MWSLLLYSALLQAPLGYNNIHSWWGTVAVCGPYCYTVLYYRRHWVITASIAGGVLLLCVVLIVILCFTTGATGYNNTNSWWGTVALCGPYCYTVFILQAPLGYNSTNSWWGTVTVCGPYCYTVFYYRRHRVITASIAGGLLLLCVVLIVILCFITGATGL